MVFTRSGSNGRLGLTKYSSIEIYLDSFQAKGIYDANQITSTIIHELGYEAHAETGIFRSLSTRKNPSLKQIQAVVPSFKGTHPGISCDAGGVKKGGYYGYAATVAMFNRHLH